MDGKTLKGSHTSHWVGALNLASQRWLDLERVADKSNEIPAAQMLIGRLDLEDKIAVLDALHTQVETARAIVQDQGGDYVLCIKGNQPGLQRQAQTLLPASVPPSTRGNPGQPRATRTSGDPGALGSTGANELSPCGASGPTGTHP
jgi:hypothetical protein